MNNPKHPLTVSDLRAALKNAEKVGVHAEPQAGRESYSSDQEVTLCITKGKQSVSIKADGWFSGPKAYDTQHFHFLYGDLDSFRNLLALLPGKAEVRFRFEHEAANMPDTFLEARGVRISALAIEVTYRKTWTRFRLNYEAHTVARENEVTIS